MTTIDQQLADRVRRLSGDYRRSAFDLWNTRISGMALMLFGAVLTAVSYRNDHLGGDNVPRAVSMGVCALMIAAGAWFLRRSGYWYRFELGQVQLRNGSDKVLWQAELAGLESVRRSYNRRGNDYLTLRWPNAKHYVAIYSSLDNALSDPDPTPESELDTDLDLAQNPTDAAETEPATLPWICKKCGEENPGNFGECWKCDQLRPGEATP